MTKEEAREAIKEAYGNSEYTDEIIKALEQDPCDELDFIQPHKKIAVNLEVCKMREATQEEREGVEQYIDSIAEPCDDAISRKEVHRQINKWVASGESDNDLMSLHNRVDTLPPVIPQQKIGRWIFVDKAKEHARCSECGYGNVDLVDGRLHNYCECCGAKMQEVK